jgi:hypothetical protein
VNAGFFRKNQGYGLIRSSRQHERGSPWQKQSGGHGTAAKAFGAVRLVWPSGGWLAGQSKPALTTEPLTPNNA